MKYILALASLAALASAQSVCDAVAAQIPSCAVGCIESAAAGVGCTPSDGYQCQCEPASATAIQSAAQTCVLSACGGDAISVIPAARSVCECAATAAADVPATPSSQDTVDAGPTTPAAESTEEPTFDSSTQTDTASYSASLPIGTGTGTGGYPVGPTSVYPPISTGGAAAATSSYLGGMMLAVLGAIAAL